MRRTGGGWRFYTRDAYAPYVERLLLDGQRARLTRAALETLAVVAYRQPVTRARVSAVRGVNCDGVLRTLLTRGLVQEVGIEPATQGTLFATTELFLERLGLSSLAELPPLGPAPSRHRRDRRAVSELSMTEAHSDGVRLQKVLAQAGVASRRAAEELIAAGRVTVDGEVVREMGRRVHPERVVVHVDGLRIVLDDALTYLALNKPRGVLSTMSDDQGRPSVGDLLVERGVVDEHFDGGARSGCSTSDGWTPTPRASCC